MIKPKKHIESLVRSGALRSARGKYLRLDMNESASGLPSDFVKKALKNLTAGHLSMYPEYEGLTRAVAKHDGVSSENICLSNGSDAAIKYIFDAYISCGDLVLLTDPTFAMYPIYCQMFQAKPIIVTYGDKFDFPFEEFMKKLSSGLKMAVLVNPNNPMGSVISPENLLKIIKKAKEAGVLLIVDEAYHYFYPKTAMREIKKFDNMVVLRTFSKICGMAGLRLGYAAACPDIIKNLKKVKPTFDVNEPSIVLSGRLLSQPDIISKAISAIAGGQKYLINKLDSRGIAYQAGYANFILIKCDRRVDEIKRKLEKKGILVHAGFRQEILKSYIRVTIAPAKEMAYFWKNFTEIWEKK